MIKCVAIKVLKPKPPTQPLHSVVQSLGICMSIEVGICMYGGHCELKKQSVKEKSTNYASRVSVGSRDQCTVFICSLEHSQRANSALSGGCRRNREALHEARRLGMRARTHARTRTHVCCRCCRGTCARFAVRKFQILTTESIRRNTFCIPDAINSIWTISLAQERPR